jgi:hypothetical protein
MASKIARSFVCVTLLLALSVSGCGGVDVEREGLEPLKLLDLSPRDGEVNVAPDVDVVAVFSDRVRLSDNAGDLNERTFRVLDAQSDPVDFSVELSELDRNEAGTEGGTAIIRLEGLARGQDYTTSIAAELKGLQSNPLNVDLHATFRVAP